MNHSRIYVDFQNADAEGRLRLTCDGTRRDLNALGLKLHDGMALRLYSDDADGGGEEDSLIAEGIARFSPAEDIWVADIDWNAIRHESEQSVGKGIPGRLDRNCALVPNAGVRDG